MIGQHWLGWWLGVVRQQANTWAKIYPALCRHIALLSYNAFSTWFTFCRILLCRFSNTIWVYLSYTGTMVRSAIYWIYQCTVHPWINFTRFISFVPFWWSLDQFYPNPWGSFHRHWGNHITAIRPVAQPCRMWWSNHDDVIKWKHFPRNWLFVRGIHRSRWIPHTKASDAELWCLLWSASE